MSSRFTVQFVFYSFSTEIRLDVFTEAKAFARIGWQLTYDAVLRSIVVKWMIREPCGFCFRDDLPIRWNHVLDLSRWRGRWFEPQCHASCQSKLFIFTTYDTQVIQAVCLHRAPWCIHVTGHCWIVVEKTSHKYPVRLAGVPSGGGEQHHWHSKPFHVSGKNKPPSGLDP